MQPARMALAAAAISLCFALPSQAAESQSWSPSKADVAQLETQLKLPAGADPISSYARFYTGQIVGGRRIMLGQYLEEPARFAPGIYLKSSGIETRDGGCTVVYLQYDVEEERVVRILCGGGYSKVPVP